MTTCAICGYSTTRVNKSPLFSRFYKCSKCAGLFLPMKVEVRYRENYFQQKTNKSVLASIARPLLDFFYWLRVKKVAHILTGRKSDYVLDYGCGSGKLVGYLRKYGINALGFDPSPAARRIAQNNKLPVLGTVKHIRNGYEMIMFWHSLEHTHNPLKIIKKTTKYLKRGSRILIAVPNVDSFEAVLTKERWFHYSYPLHQVHFTPKALATMLQKSGFRNVKFDFFNPEYTFTGLTQSLLNVVLPKDILYSVVTHRRLSTSRTEAFALGVLSLLLIILFLPVLIMFYTLALIFRKTGAMVVVARYE